MILHLGVIDLPYVQRPSPSNRKGKKKVSAGTQTTGDVAGWLEEKYDVMQHYVDMHQDDIVAAIENGLAGSLETVLIGGSPATDLYASAASRIEEGFRKFIESKEMDGLVMGVPTLASLQGVSHRFKNPRFKRVKSNNPLLPPNRMVPRDVRPSFIDTGLYLSSFKAWVD